MTVNKSPARDKPGRRSKYRPDVHPKIARDHLAQGKTQEGCAIVLGIGFSTFSEWKARHPKFQQAVKEGCDIADEEVVEALKKSAKGFMAQAGTENEKEIPPNPTSMIFWLKNRKPDQWRDKREVVADIKTTDMTEDALNEKIKQLIGDG